MKRREFISVFGGMAASLSLAAYVQESATMGTTKATTATLPQVEVARVHLQTVEAPIGSQ
jgi:hypothetical protein